MERIKVNRPGRKELEHLGVESWDIWEKHPQEFDWAYTHQEHCYIIQGKARIITDEEITEIKKGDYVVFPVGLKCRWKIARKIKKYYQLKEI
ncbi:MAG: cupin domain-containing protein [Spirochaetota bacterium]